MNNRGVTETTGTVLLFSVIIISVAITYTAGIPILQEQKDSSVLETTTDGFHLVDSNIEDHTQLGVEQRVTRISSEEGKYSMGEGTSITVSIDGTTEASIDSKPIIYSLDTHSVEYDSGGIFRTRGDSSSVVEAPPIRVKNGALHLGLIKLTGDDTHAPSRTVSVRTRLQNSSAETFTGLHDVTLTVSSPRSDAWQTHLENEGFNCSSVDDTTIECSISNMDVVSIQRTVINTRFGT